MKKSVISWQKPAKGIKRVCKRHSNLLRDFLHQLLAVLGTMKCSRWDVQVSMVDARMQVTRSPALVLTTTICEGVIYFETSQKQLSRHVSHALSACGAALVSMN